MSALDPSSGFTHADASAWRHRAGLAALCALLYFLAARFALAFVIQPEGLAVIWPAAGILLGFLLIQRRRDWPLTIGAVFVVVTAVNLSAGNRLTLSLGFGVANCLGPTLTCLAIQFLVGRRPRLGDSRDVWRFVIAAACSTPATAVVGAVVVSAATGGPFWRVWQIWWLQDGMGVLILAPVVLEIHRLVRSRQIEWPPVDLPAGLGFVGVVGVSAFVFLMPPDPVSSPFARPYLLVPFIGYLALRFGSVGAVGSNLVVATAAIIGLAFDVGAFETFSPFNREQALGAQLFLAVIGVTSMIAGAVSAERRLVEHSLRASQERLADAQRVARLGSWTVAFTPGGDVWTVSDELHRIWGEPPGTPATTESGFERIHPDDRARVADVWTAAIQSRVPSQWDQRILVGGDERWIAVHARVERTPDGQPVTMTGTNQDITDRKRIETELRATEAKYRLVTENASDVIWLLDVESGRFVYVSPSVEKLRGYSPEEVMALPAEAALTSASQDRVKQTMADHLARFFAGNSPGGPIITLVDQPTKGGTVVPTEVTTRYVRDESSGRVYAVGISRDISERCVTEGRLANLASEQATVLNTVPATIWCAIERKIVWTNPAMLDLLGYTPDEAIGMGVDPFYASRTDYDDVGQHGYAAMARGETFSCEVLMRRKSGDDVWCHLAGRYIDPADRARGAIWVIQDITARKLAEQQLRSSADAQRVLLREVNHRVKNNLSALLAMVHMEQDRAVVEGQPAVKRTMSDLDARLRSLATVHAILSFSEWRPVRLDDLCSRLIAQVIGASAGHLRNLQVTESQVVVDANQAQSLALVVSELATNTLKYGADPGQPSIWVSIAQSDTQVFLTYRDRGPGFPPTVLSGGGTATNVGLELVGGLVHQTLRGRVTMSNDAGAVVSIEFPAASPKGQES